MFGASFIDTPKRVKSTVEMLVIIKRFGSNAPLEFSIGFYAHLVSLGYDDPLTVYPEYYIRLIEALLETKRTTCPLATAYFSFRRRLFLMT